MLLMLGKVKEEIDFFIAKGVADRVAEKLNLELSYKAGEIKGLHQAHSNCVVRRQRNWLYW